MKYNILIALILLASVFTGCGKEDALSPSGERDNWFMADPDATDAESVLRRKFYEENQTYLLFNDTLYREQVGTLADGQPVYRYELLELNWEFSSTLSDTRWTLTYLEEDEQAAAAAVVARYFLQKMKAERPYSVLLTNGIIKVGKSLWGGESEEYLDYHLNHRCMVIDMTKSENGGESVFGKELCEAWVQNLLKDSKYATELTAFYDYAKDETGASRYDEYKNIVFADIPGNCIGTNVPLEPFYEKGFLVNTSRSKLLKAEADVNSYLSKVLENDEEGFLTEFEDYPIVLAKYRIMRDVVSKILILE